MSWWKRSTGWGDLGLPRSFFGELGPAFLVLGFAFGDLMGLLHATPCVPFAGVDTSFLILGAFLVFAPFAVGLDTMPALWC